MDGGAASGLGAPRPKRRPGGALLLLHEAFSLAFSASLLFHIISRHLSDPTLHRPCPQTVLRDNASRFVDATTALVAQFTSAPTPRDASGEDRHTATLLQALSGAWEDYLRCFTAWKSHDAAGLEKELIGMAAALHASLLRKLGTAAVAAASAPGGAAELLSHDRQAMLDGLRDDLALIQARLAGLTGAAGVARMNQALQAATEEVAAEERAAAAAAIAVSTSTAQLNNERILHELILDPEWRLPRDTTQQVSEAEPVRGIVERAFWDSLAARSDVLAAAAGMLLELKAVLVDLAPGSLRDALDTTLSAALPAAESERIDAAAIGSAVRAFADAFKLLCAPARRQALDAALRQLHEAEAVMLTAAPQAPDLGSVVASALRLLFDQLAQLKRDLVNAQVSFLVPLATSALGIHTARAKFAARHGLSVHAVDQCTTLQPDALPATRSFLAGAARVLAATVVGELGEAMLGRPSPELPTSTAPASMHTGRGTPATPSTTSGGSGAGIPGVAGLRTVEALLRIGMVDLVATLASQATGATPPAVPETLDLDDRRLQACAAQLDRCLLMAASLLLLPSLRSSSAAASDATDHATALRQRLGAVLAGDVAADAPAKLAHVAAELARVARCEPATCERLLTKMTAPGSSPRGALTATLARALRAHLLLGRAYGAAKADAALTRAGAAALGPEIEVLAAQMQCICSAHDKLYGAWLMTDLVAAALGAADGSAV
jgi:hypothetical protein